MKKRKWFSNINRRTFLKFTGAGATAVAAGLASCEDGDGERLDADLDVTEEDVGIEDVGPEGELPPEVEDDIPGEEQPRGCPEMPPYEDTREVKTGTETTTICPYCGCGCGLIVTVASVAGEEKITNIEGDPDHPINMGALCSKGSALYQVNRNDRRLTKVLHRAPGADAWEEITWDDAITAIAQKIKQTRDENFITQDSQGRTVNRIEAIGCLGGAALDNEECYLLSKAMRSLGVVYFEHQARI